MTDSRVYLFIFNLHLHMMKFINLMSLEEAFVKFKFKLIETIII